MREIDFKMCPRENNSSRSELITHGSVLPDILPLPPPQSLLLRFLKRDARKLGTSAKRERGSRRSDWGRGRFSRPTLPHKKRGEGTGKAGRAQFPTSKMADLDGKEEDTEDSLCMSLSNAGRYSYASLCTILLASMYESQRDRQADWNYRFLMA